MKKGIRRGGQELVVVLVAVVIDDKTGLFSPGSAPDAALYCGLVQPGEICGGLYLAPGICGLSHRQQRMRNPEARGQSGLVQEDAGGRGGGHGWVGQ